MIGTLSLAAALTIIPSQAGTLNLVNIRTTYGNLGAQRTDNRYLPNDLFFVCFDIESLTVSPEGKVSYVISMEVTDKANKAIFKPDRPSDRDDVLPLGGSRLAAYAFVALKPDQEPGTYNCRVTVVDKANNAKKTLEKQFDVVPKAFGLIALNTTSDVEGNHPAPTSGIVGQDLFIHCALVGFGRGADKKPNGQVELRVYDEAKKPTLAKFPTAVMPAEVPENDPVLFRFYVPFNREGTFTAELKATDNVSGKTSTISFPIKVLGR